MCQGDVKAALLCCLGSGGLPACWWHHSSLLAGDGGQIQPILLVPAALSGDQDTEHLPPYQASYTGIC